MKTITEMSNSELIINAMVNSGTDAYVLATSESELKRGEILMAQYWVADSLARDIKNEETKTAMGNVWVAS